MTCFAEERFVELLDRGGLESTRPEERTHLETCAACRESWATVAAAGEILVEARPRRAVARGWRVIPVAIAAAMLLTIVGVIAVRKIASPVTKPMADPITTLLQGSPEESRQARESLLKGGRKSLSGLLAARPRFKGSARLQALQDLIFEIKRSAAQDPEAVDLFKRLETLKMDLAFENTALTDVLGFIRDFSKLNLCLDPTVKGRTLNVLNMKDSSLKSILEMICTVMDLDFDVRYGVLFVSTPIRLWSTEPGVGLPEAWKRQVLGGADASVAAKMALIRTTLDMESVPMATVADYLSQICGIPFKPEEEIGEQLIDLKVQNLGLVHVLELLTLPYGWDARTEAGAVLIFKKP